METQKAKIEQAIRRGEKPPRITKEDMRMLRNTKNQRKYEIEQSLYYVGYKLFWILGMFLYGKKFPSGTLETIKFKVQVFNIVDFVTDEDNLAAMLDFDAETFFDTMVDMFTLEPWHFITHPGKYKFKFQKKAIAEGRDLAEEPLLCNIPIASQILSIFKLAAERSNRREPAFTRACYQELILKIVIYQNEQIVGTSTKL